MTDQERAARLLEALATTANDSSRSLLLSISLSYKGADGRAEYLRDVLALSRLTAPQIQRRG